MTAPSATLQRMVRPRKPARGARHMLLESMADGMFRGPAKLEHGIDLLVQEAAAERLSQASTLSGFPEAAVPHLLEHSDGRTGLLVLDGAMTDALIEQQTLGRISPAPRVERPVTSIDAALSTGFATSIAEKMAAIATEQPGASPLVGFRCGRPQIDPASLSLALASKNYDVLRVRLDLGPGLKTCLVQLILPADDTDVAAPAPGKANPAMVALMQDACLKLHVRLPNVSLSLKTLIELKPESLIRLPIDALAMASLRDRAGATVGLGRLGQLKGCRAIRIAPGQGALATTPEIRDDTAMLPLSAKTAPGAGQPEMMDAADFAKALEAQDEAVEGRGDVDVDAARALDTQSV